MGHPPRDNRTSRLLVAIGVVAALMLAAPAPGFGQTQGGQTTNQNSAGSQESIWIFLAKNGGLGFIGGLVGALIGFGGLIFSTQRAYQNVINAQKDAAETRKAERDAQIQLDTKSLALALFGEVVAIKAKCEIHQDVLKRLQAEWKDKVASDDELAAEIISLGPTPNIPAGIYQVSTARLGMLGNPTVQFLVELYSRLVSTANTGTAPGGGIHVKFFMQNVATWINNLGYTIELASLVSSLLWVIGETGDWRAVSRLQAQIEAWMKSSGITIEELTKALQKEASAARR